MIYLASPYSHPRPEVRTRRYIHTREFVWHHLQLGQPLFSPIVYCHQFARDFGAPLDAISWAHLNDVLLERTESMWVLTLVGWNESRGVNMELEMAERLGIPVEMKEPLPYAQV